MMVTTGDFYVIIHSIFMVVLVYMVKGRNCENSMKPTVIKLSYESIGSQIINQI